MKRAVIILVLLGAALVGGLMMWLMPAGRTSNSRGDWSGHTVSFHLPRDASLRHINARTPAPAVITFDTAGGLKFNSTKLAAPETTGLLELQNTITKAMVAGTTEFHIEVEGAALASIGVQLMAACVAAEAPEPSLAASVDVAVPELVRGSSVIAGFMPPLPPTVPAASTMVRDIRKKEAVILYVDGVNRRFVLREGDKPDVQLGIQALYQQLKIIAALNKDPDNPQLSNQLVLIHAGPKATWQQFEVAVMECAKVGIWRIEAVATPGED